MDSSLWLTDGPVEFSFVLQVFRLVLWGLGATNSAFILFHPPNLLHPESTLRFRWKMSNVDTEMTIKVGEVPKGQLAPPQSPTRSLNVTFLLKLRFHA